MARTKAAKRQAKRGRPKKEGIIREPNGRRSRAKEPAAKVAVEARMKMFNLTKAQAMDQKAATNLGRLAMMGRVEGLSQDQYEAALRYLDIRNDYQKSLLSPGAYFEENGSVDSNDPGAYEDWCKRVKSAFNSAQEAIQEAQNENRSENLWAGLQCIIINDEMMHHLLGSARLVCNALHRHFMLDNKRKSPNK
ncbi:hypothetical protein [Brucella sp. 2280]|uniref:hypothetical protein n=1 Tax=Brucella sp. 2280 TaxID=2592625 RepID=UPI001297D95D|nr:hypothetical protein [Brucella sp. 2280]QGA55882.1 hypothetical protein GHC20_01770 [Brucella sp. 2280]